MTLMIFPTDDGDDDTSAVQEKDGTNMDSAATTYFIGSTISGKVVVHVGAFVRFALTGLPAGVTINGCKADWRSNGNSIASVKVVECGFLADDGLWSGAGRFGEGNYPQRQNMPWAQWNDDLGDDPGVYVNGAPAGTSAMAASTGGQRWTMGDGTGVGTPTMTITGLTAHLQLAIDAMGTDDPIVAFHAFSQFTGLASGPLVESADIGSPFRRPFLHVEFDEPDPSGVFTVVPQAQVAGGTMTVTINGAFSDYTGTDVGADTTWTSSIEGLLVTGTNFVEQDLSVGVHVMSVESFSAALLPGDETDYDDTPTTEGVFAGGADYSIGDIIQMSDGSTVLVNTVSTGAVATFDSYGFSSGVADGVTITQVSVAPAGGTGFTITPGVDNIVAQSGTQNFTITVFNVPSDIHAAITAATVAGLGGGDNTSLQIAGGLLSAGAGGGSGEKGIAVIDAIP